MACAILRRLGIPLQVERSVIRKITEGRNSSAFWIDPRTGKSLSAGEVSNSGVRQFTTPDGWEDALLILEPPTGQVRVPR
jgi:hypothetical protein